MQLSPVAAKAPTTQPPATNPALLDLVMNTYDAYENVFRAIEQKTSVPKDDPAVAKASGHLSEAELGLNTFLKGAADGTFAAPAQAVDSAKTGVAHLVAAREAIAGAGDTVPLDTVSKLTYASVTEGFLPMTDALGLVGMK